MERVEVRRPAAACSKAEHPIHPVSTAISTSRQQTTLGGHNKNARRPRPRMTCPPPLDGASMTRGGNDVDDRHTRYCSPAWHRPQPGHPTGSAVAACAGPVSAGPRRPAKATATAVTASNPAIRTSARIVTGARAAEGPQLRRTRVGAPAGWTAVDTCVGAAPGRGAIGHSGSGGRNPDQKILHTVVIDNAVGHVADDIEVQLAGGGAARAQRRATER